MTTPKPLSVPLFVPGHRPELLVKAGASGADAVILDLEDAVADADKPAAHATLMSRSGLPVPLVVRCNGFDSSWFAKDMAALAKNPPQMIMLPKAESVDHLDVIAKQLGVGMPIIPIVESALGLAAIEAMMMHPSVLQCAFGHLDFSLILELIRNGNRFTMRVARLLLHLALGKRHRRLTASRCGLMMPKLWLVRHGARVKWALVASC